MTTPAQDLEDWSAVGSLRNMLGLGRRGIRETARRKESVLRKCETDVKFRIESDGEEDSDVEDSPGKGDRIRKKSSIKDTHGALLKHLARKGLWWDEKRSKVHKKQYFPARNQTETLHPGHLLRYESTAPGKLCHMASSGLNMSSLAASSLNMRPGLTPTNRFRSRASNLQVALTPL